MRLKSSICPECQQREDELYDTVVAYLKENPNSTVAEVATALHCDIELIDKFIQSGRLNSVKPAWQSRCRNCGTAISSGDMCEKCRKQLASDISKALPTKKIPTEEPSRFGKATKIYLIDRVKDK